MNKDNFGIKRLAASEVSKMHREGDITDNQFNLYCYHWRNAVPRFSDMWVHWQVHKSRYIPELDIAPRWQDNIHCALCGALGSLAPIYNRQPCLCVVCAKVWHEA